MTREEAEAGIAAITAQLKGPMSNLERALLVADRTDLRALLHHLPTGPEAVVPQAAQTADDASGMSEQS